MKWEDEDAVITDDDMYLGVTLIIGFVPGLKINVIPLLHTNTVCFSFYLIWLMLMNLLSDFLVPICVDV